MRFRLLLTFLFTLLFSLCVRAQTRDTGIKQDTKNAAHSTARATKKTGHKIKHGTKKVVHKSAHATRKAAAKTEDKTAEPAPK